MRGGGPKSSQLWRRLPVGTGLGEERAGAHRGHIWDRIVIGMMAVIVLGNGIADNRTDTIYILRINECECIVGT